MKIEDFVILRYLEEGKFGLVFLARHKVTNFICALKQIPKKTYLNDSRVFNQLLREIKIQSFLDHPNIVQLYTFFVDEEYLYLVLEVCLSGNLYIYLKEKGRLLEEEVRVYLKQVCHAVEYMQDNDIIHRDIKP